MSADTPTPEKKAKPVKPVGIWERTFLASLQGAAVHCDDEGDAQFTVNSAITIADKAQQAMQARAAARKAKQAGQQA